jgi:hypothetical protein
LWANSSGRKIVQDQRKGMGKEKMARAFSEEGGVKKMVEARRE